LKSSSGDRGEGGGGDHGRFTKGRSDLLHRDPVGGETSVDQGEVTEVFKSFPGLARRLRAQETPRPLCTGLLNFCLCSEAVAREVEADGGGER